MTDLTPNDLSQLSDEEFNALCPQGHHAPGSAQPLSPAAQAVMIAGTMGNQNVVNDPVYRQCIAAALRAAADQLAYAHGSWAGSSAIINEDELLAIAAELEAH
jgi:hypothetical protein